MPPMRIDVFEHLMVPHIHILLLIFYAMLCKRFVYTVLLEMLEGSAYYGMVIYSLPLISCLFWAFLWLHTILPQLHDILVQAQRHFHGNLVEISDDEDE